jgi:hypothetical protein
LRKSSDFTRQVVRDSIEVEWRKGTFIRVMGDALGAVAGAPSTSSMSNRMSCSGAV